MTQCTACPSESTTSKAILYFITCLHIHTKSFSTFIAATQLKPGDLGVLKVLVQDVAAYWVNIADQLGLQSQVDTIRRSPDNVTPEDFLRNLLNIWLHQDRLPTLEELCRALKSDNAIIGGAGVAKRLEEEFKYRQGL